MKAISKLRRHFREHIDKILFIVFLLLVALTVAVIVSESIANCLQQLLSEKYDVLKTIGYCVLGVVSIWLALSADKRAKAMDATAKNTDAGQRQERLKNAIEHLGHESNSVRMSGTYQLFHLAKDTEDEDLRQTVMDILCAHIRQTTGEDKYKEKYKTKPSEEIQGLLTLLFTQKHDVFEDCPINLQGSYLNGATLSQARLKKTNLREAQLQGADIRQTQLQGADLTASRLQGAYLEEAQLQDANLSRTQLQEANLSRTQLQNANLREAQLQRADLRQAQLQNANLREAQLQEANLREAQLQEANLREAQLQEANLREAQLQEANLREAQLQGANLSNAQLQGADLSNNAASTPDSDKDKED